MSRIRRIAPGLGRGGLLGNTEGPESYLRELDTLPSQFARATGGTETVISQNGKYYRVHTFTDTDPTSLLLNFDGSNGSTTFTDDSGWGHAVTANGNAQISTTQSKFGGSSLALDGTGDYLTVGANPQIYLESDPFTVEFWMYVNSIGSQTVPLSQYLGNPAGRWLISVEADGKIAFAANGLSGNSYQITASPISVSTWVHIAVTRNASNSFSLWIDGEQVNVLTATGSLPNVPLDIGTIRSPSTADRFFPGYIDSLRITKGQALYTAAFTPPTQALTRVGSGSLTFTRGGAVEYLVVGGGGGGGYEVGGGGGAGGVIESVSTVSAGSRLVAVGSGGAAKTSAGVGNSGSNSTFDVVIAYGGGGGGAFNSTSYLNGLSGGSGGGGTIDTTGIAAGSSGGSGVSTQGYDGATPDGTPPGTGGGGGGASETPASDGSGGDGIQSSISGTASYYGGGGGAGDAFQGVSNDGPALGGLGGGGDGGNNSPVAATAGDANTGGGGGGGSGVGGGAPAVYGASGGSGIVIARYRITQAEYEAEAA